MRYALYWLPNPDTDLYQHGYDWLNQAGEFHQTIETMKHLLSFYDFMPALMTLKKYGFHGEFLPPFYLKNAISEYDIFSICQKVAKKISCFDIKMELQNRGNSLLLSSYYKNSTIINFRKHIFSDLANFIEFDKIVAYPSTGKFQIALSNSYDNAVHQDLTKIAHSYWQQPLKKPISINYFQLCYQTNKNVSFKPLMQFDFINLLK